MEKYKIKFKIVFNFVTIAFILNIGNIYSQSDEILRTDKEGNILGGDIKDWHFNKNHYKYFLKYKDFFYRPNIMSEPHTLEIPAPITFDVNSNTVTLKWTTEREVDFKEFVIERKGVLDNEWKKVGAVEAEGNSNSVHEYKFVDHNLEYGVYSYRLKLFSDNDPGIEYFNMPGQVFIPTAGEFIFYPAYPNPVADTVNICFYFSEKDVVSLFFLNGKDTTYILNHEPQERGFYKLTIDKKSLGFDNEIKRLYVNCKSCDNKKNFGDIQF